MPTRSSNLTRLVKERNRAEQHQLRCSTQATLLLSLHPGQDLLDAVTTPEDQKQLEDHYLKVLVSHLLRLRWDNKREELIEAIDQIHPAYLPTVIDHLTPLTVEPCSEDEAMPPTGP